MRKWLTIGGVLMLLAWSPFLWKELTSSPAEKKGRDLPSEDVTAEPEVAAAGAAAAEPEPAAEQEAPAEAEKGATAAADPNAKPSEPSAHAAKQEPAQPGDPAEGNDEAEDEAPPPAPTATGPTSVLKEAFDKQTRDALWAKDSEARISGLFGGADVPAEMLQNASCRKAVCRLQLRWTRERAPAYVSVYQSLHQQFGPEVGVEPIGEADADDGHQEVDVYVARKGYTVADLAK